MLSRPSSSLVGFKSLRFRNWMNFILAWRLFGQRAFHQSEWTKEFWQNEFEKLSMALNLFNKRHRNGPKYIIWFQFISYDSYDMNHVCKVVCRPWLFLWLSPSSHLWTESFIIALYLTWCHSSHIKHIQKLSLIIPMSMSQDIKTCFQHRLGNTHYRVNKYRRWKQITEKIHFSFSYFGFLTCLVLSHQALSTDKTR